MHSQALLDAYLVATAACLLTVVAYATWKRVRLLAVFAICLPDLIVAATLAWFFRIANIEVVAQFAAGDAAREEQWSAWFAMWPVLLFGIGIAGAAQCMGSVFTLLDRTTWRWVPVLLASAITSALALATLLSWFPDA